MSRFFSCVVEVASLLDGRYGRIGNGLKEVCRLCTSTSRVHGHFELITATIGLLIACFEDLRAFKS